MSLLRKGVLVSCAKLAGVGMSTAAAMIYARHLGPEGMGQFDLFRITSTLAMTFAALGVGNANIYFLNNRRLPVEQIASGSLRYAALVGPPLVVALTCVVVGLPGFFGRIPPGVALIFALAPAAQLAVNVLVFILVARLEARRTVAVDLAHPLVLLLSGALLALAGWLNVPAALVAHTLATLASLGLVLLFIRPLLDFSRLPPWSQTGEIVRYGAQIAAATALYLLAYHLGVFLLRWLRPEGFGELGLYTRAISVCGLVLLAPQSVGPLLYARWSELAGSQRMEQVRLAIRLNGTVGLVSAAVLMLVGRYVLWILYGREFVAASDILRLLAPALMFTTLYDACSQLLTSDGRARTTLWILSGTVVIQGAITLAAIPAWGARGAALGTLCGNAFMALSALLVCRHLYGLSPLQCLLVRPADITYIWQALRARPAAPVPSGP